MCHISASHRYGDDAHGKGKHSDLNCNFPALAASHKGPLQVCPMCHLMAPSLGLIHDIVLVAKNGVISHPLFVKGLHGAPFLLE